MFRHDSIAERGVLLYLLLCAGPGHAQTSAAEQRTFSAEFDSLSLDLRSNQSIYTNVSLSDGRVTITAGEGATDETSFESSQWRFAGGVTIAFDGAELTADTATFEFENGELLYGELDGDPVEITDYIDERQTTVRGTADRIALDNRAQTAALYGRATLALGANEYSGCDLVYHLTDKTFNSGSSECGVLLTLFPEENGPGDTPERTPAPR